VLHAAERTNAAQEGFWIDRNRGDGEHADLPLLGGKGADDNPTLRQLLTVRPVGFEPWPKEGEIYGTGGREP
jgi:hypothetical protein